jgi:hypothetical protein
MVFLRNECLFLVEGRRSERKVYPAWLSHLLPELKRVNTFTDVSTNNYFIISGEGYPSILNDHIPNAVEDINDIGKYNFFIIVLDAEEISVNERLAEVTNAINRQREKLSNISVRIIIQNRCLETWLLGNRRVFVRNPESEKLRSFIKYYNVETDDPEYMGKFRGFNTHAQFHLAYLKSIFYEKNVSYSKKRPWHVMNQPYLNQLILRIEQTNHLKTFAAFIELCDELKGSIDE